MVDIIVNLRNTKVLNKTFSKTGSKILVSDQITPILDELSLGRDKKLVPKAPVYMYHSKNDEVIPYKSASNTAHFWCSNGGKVKFETFTGIEMGHVTTELLNTPNVLSFIRSSMDGKKLDNCQWPSTGNPLWSPDVLGAKLTEVLNAVMNFWGAAIGRGDATLKEHIQQGKDI